MRKSTKNLLGLGGLALVGAMTVAALAIPVPDVDATSSVGGDVKIIVKVHSGNPEVEILTPADGTVTTNPVTNINTSYDDIENLGFTLKWGSLSNTTSTNLGTFVPDDSQIGGAGEYSFGLNLRAYGGYNSYTVTSTMESSSGQELSDNSSFRYAPVVVTYIGTDENGDPMFEVEYDENVTSIGLDLLDSNGKSILDSPVGFTNPTPGKGGKTTITIPAGSYDLSDGNYVASATAQGPQADAEVDEGSLVYDENSSTITVDFDYDDNTAEIYFHIIDKNGNVIVVPSAYYAVSNPGTAGSDTITIDLSGLDLSGYDLSEFTVVAYPYAIKGSTKNLGALDFDNGPVAIAFAYKKPDAPDVPNTGLFGGIINFARTDYLITGAAGFSLVTICAFLLLKKQDRRSSKRRR